jgi:hypothetical protein
MGYSIRDGTFFHHTAVRLTYKDIGVVIEMERFQGIPIP